jgi:hypothetical protein
VTIGPATDSPRGYAERRLRPLSRRRLSTALPARVAIRARTRASSCASACSAGTSSSRSLAYGYRAAGHRLTRTLVTDNQQSTDQTKGGVVYKSGKPASNPGAWGMLGTSWGMLGTCSSHLTTTSPRDRRGWNRRLSLTEDHVSMAHRDRIVRPQRPTQAILHSGIHSSDPTRLTFPRFVHIFHKRLCTLMAEPRPACRARRRTVSAGAATAGSVPLRDSRMSSPFPNKSTATTVSMHPPYTCGRRPTPMTPPARPLPHGYLVVRTPFPHFQQKVCS